MGVLDINRVPMDVRIVLTSYKPHYGHDRQMQDVQLLGFEHDVKEKYDVALVSTTVFRQEKIVRCQKTTKGKHVTDGKCPYCFLIPLTDATEKGRRVFAWEQVRQVHMLQRHKPELPRPVHLLAHGWIKSYHKYPIGLEGPDADLWRQLFGSLVTDVHALKAAMRLASAKNVVLGSGRPSDELPRDIPVDIMPTHVSEDGARGWSF